MACSQGALAQLGINDYEMEFLTIEGGAVYELVDNTDLAIRGTLDKPKERVKDGLIKIDLHISMNPSPTELDVLLPLIGFNEASLDSFEIIDGVANELSAFTVVIDRVAKVHTYANCKVNSAVFRSQKGSQPLTLDLHIMGTTETEGDAGTFSVTNPLDTDTVFAHHECTVNLRSAARTPDRVAIGIDNKIERRFNNSQTADTLCASNRDIYLAMSVPYDSDHTALYTTPGPGGPDASGATGTVTYTPAAGRSTLFTFANLKEIAQSPPIMGKTEIRLPVYMKAYSSGSTKSLVITHDNTP